MAGKTRNIYSLALCTKTPSPHRFFSLATPWPLAGMAQSGFAVSFHLNSWLLLAASPQSLIVVEVAP